ncbi:X-Pro dipeptidyl-peptidase domain protein [Parafrankia sp. EAN1pec]|uniref:CocE/NonD family hydrolase n=1 Tax=Parafrankia sp. (strain EAN1pec) TaxID=298653 RepID=UPI0000540A9A|nr:X-Pro dipeptidyl-peptidase domain protein [Frankia sp. EAN1pec]
MSYRVEKNVMVPMRDDVTLCTDLFLPEGGPAPALIIRMGYSKEMFEKLSLPLIPNVLSLVEAGYAIVYQECRGTYGSGGVFRPLVDDPDDGVDTLEWTVKQPWCDGNVGSYGLSYHGMTQWATASQAPSGLKAMAVAASTTDLFRAPWYSDGGAVSWQMTLGWVAAQIVTLGQYALERGTGDLEPLVDAGAMMLDLEPHLRKLPITDQPALNKHAPWWKEWWEHPTRDEFWTGLATAEHTRDMTTPALHIVGWFDFFAPEATRAYTRMRAQAATPQAREGQRLIVGPWDHTYQDAAYRSREFGQLAGAPYADITGAHLRFFDRHLRGNNSADVGASPVRIFVMGVDQWRDEQDWPLPDTTYVDYYLDGPGRANTADGDGVLTTEAPTTEAAESYRFDPLDPVPTLGGRLNQMGFGFSALYSGPVDQRPVEERNDVLCFTTPVLEEPVEVTGNISLVLHASSSALDTDFTGKLVDVHPDGRALYLTDGILRARYRESLANPKPLVPGEVYELILDLGLTSNVFLPGHRIRLEVSSSNFPRYDRNTNTGNVISFDTATPVVAGNQILHGPAHPSRLVLPIIRRLRTDRHG